MVAYRYLSTVTAAHVRGHNTDALGIYRAFFEAPRGSRPVRLPRRPSVNAR